MNSKNIALLLSTWNATLDEADARLGGYRGTRVGEASHPGPRPRQASMCTEFRVRSLNCQSPNGAWSFFADCCEFAERQVIALQETRMAPAEEAAFLRYALKQGFHAHSVCGELDRGGRPRGRVLLLVDKRLRFRKSGACTSKDAQVAASFVEDVLLMTFYAPPDRSKNCQQQACEHLQEVLLSERVPPCWLAVGESNEVPTDSYIDQTLQSFRGVLQQQNSPSRWAGSAELDWIHTSCPERLSKLQFVDLNFSDHKVLECFVNIPRKNLTSGLLHPTPSWQKPEQATSTWWRDLLQQLWWRDLLQQLWVQQVSSQFVPLEQPDMDESWQQFVKALAVPSRKLTGWAMLRISNWPAPSVTMDTKERYPNGKSVPGPVLNLVARAACSSVS